MSKARLSPIDVSVHDTSQIEVKTLYRVPEGVPLGQDISFVQDVFLFIPKSMGINQDSYPKDLFYRSLTNYIRIKTPKVLGDDDRRHGRLDRIMPKLSLAASRDQKPASVTSALNEVRLFGAYVNDQFKVLASTEQSVEAAASLEQITRLMAAYRDVMDKLLPSLNDGRLQSLGEAFQYVDEFLSNRFEECIVDHMKRGSDFSSYMRAEFNRRDRMGYLQVLNTNATDEAARESFAFRMSGFKKYISSVLYLEMKRVRKDRVFANLAAGIGAAAAAILNSLADPNQRTSVSGSLVTNIRDSLPLMIAVVAIVYVTKDRLKEYLKEHFLAWFRPLIPDYSFEIKSKQGKVIGRCQEDMGFIDRKSLPAEIKTLRDYRRELSLPADSSEEMLHYRRRLKLDRLALEGLFKNTNSLKDILRFDFHPFLAKLSNPSHEEHFIDRDFKLCQTVLPKIYHLNIVIRHQMFSKEHGELSQSFQRVRLILDKNAIRRIEYPALEELLAQDQAA